MDLEKGTFISSVSGYEEEYYLSNSSWSGVVADWKQRFEVGDVVADPEDDWEPSTAEEYIDQQVATITGDLAGETVARQTADANLQNQVDTLSAAVGTGGTVDQRIQAEATTRANADTGLSNRITPLEQAVGTGGSVDTRISNAVAVEALARQNADSQLQNNISAEANARAASDDQLRQLYQALTESNVIVGPLPASGVVNTIYRVPGTSSYVDWMWYNNTWVKMAEYNNAIDNMPTNGSNNLVKSGGVATFANQNWYCATLGSKPTILLSNSHHLEITLNSPLQFLGAGNSYGSVAEGSSYMFSNTNKYLVVSESASEIITPTFIGTALGVTYYLHAIDREELRADYKVVLAYNGGKIWSRNNWASLSDNEMLDIESRINNINFYILGKVYIRHIAATYQYVVNSNGLSIFDNAGGYKEVNNFSLTIATEQNLYLSASESTFVEPDLTTRGTGERLYLIAENYSNQISEKARDFLVLGHNDSGFYDPFNLIVNNLFVNWFASCPTKPTVISNGRANYTITLTSPLTILGSGNNYGNVAAGSSYTLPGSNNFLVLSTSESEVIDPVLEGTAQDVTYYIHVVSREAIRPITKVLAYSLREGGLFSKDNWIGLSDYEILKLSSNVDYPLLPPELPIQNPLLRNSKLINLVQNKKQDVTIIHLGDSISTNGRYSQSLPDSEAAYNPPRMDEKYLIYFMEAMLRWRGQEYRRSDAKTEKGGNVDMFTEVGTAETKYYDEAWDWQYETIANNWYNLWTRILTGTNEAPASVTFTIPAGIKRFAFIYRTDYLCASQTQVIMLSNVARIIQSDGTLVEANGYTFSMKEQDEVLTKTITASDGTTQTRTMRKSRGQVRLDFLVDDISSTKTVTIRNVGAGRLNYWGVEYTPYDKFFRYINVSRGGHNLDALKCFEEWDIDAFKPDAIIVGTPIINEGAMSVVSPNTPNTPEIFANRIKDRYDELSDKSYSPEVIPYILYIGVQANIVDQTTGQYLCSSINNYGYVDVFKYIGVLDNLLEIADYPIINLFNRIDAYAHKLADNEGTNNIWLSAIIGSGSTGKTLTADNVHLNNHGSLLSFRLIKEFFNF